MFVGRSSFLAVREESTCILPLLIQFTVRLSKNPQLAKEDKSHGDTVISNHCQSYVCSTSLSLTFCTEELKANDSLTNAFIGVLVCSTTNNRLLPFLLIQFTAAKMKLPGVYQVTEVVPQLFFGSIFTISKLSDVIGKR
jgi:hypothetical protein